MLAKPKALEFVELTKVSNKTVEIKENILLFQDFVNMVKVLSNFCERSSCYYSALFF